MIKFKRDIDFFSIKSLLSLICSLCLLCSFAAENTYWTNIAPIPTNYKHSAGQYIRIFSPTQVISTDSILILALQNKFEKQDNDVYSTLSCVDRPVWLYFKTDSFKNNLEHFLILENANLNLISLYKYEDEGLKLVRVKGMGIKYQADNLFPEQISFNIDPASIYFIEAYDFHNANFPIYIRTNINNTQRAVIKNFFNAFYWGVISVIGIIILLLYVRSKEIVFLYYALFLFGTLLLNACLEGYLFAYLWPNHPEINAYKFSIYAISATATPLFVYHFLLIKDYFKKTKKIFTGLTLLFFIVCVYNILGHYAVAMYLLQSIGFAQIILYIAYGIIIWKNGSTNALYFIVAWSAYLLSIIAAILSSLDLIPNTSFVNNYVQIGTLIQVSIFSYIIAGKYQENKIRNVESQKKLIDILKDREVLLTSQNDNLEHIVQLRTTELNNKNNELNNLNESLNEIVTQKTWELQKSLEEIITTNDQLKQFNYITSHNLRGPVSSLKGLISLYQLENDPNEQTTYITKAAIVINRMDDILFDLNKILSFKNTSLIKEVIDFETIISNNIRHLDIKRVDINLYIDERLTITGIKSFYESIFYNLFSNAQKYKDPSRPLKIDIQIAHFNINRFSISIKDNGLGMDESKIGDKLFGFYKRFHSHIEGKGLGLYMTKNQIEILGGNIRAESVLGKGTNFIIELPC